MDSLTLILLPVAVLAGFITSIAGGGGIVFVTTAIAIGVEPLNALALNRVTDLGVLTGSFNNFRKVPHIPLRSLKLFAPLFLFGAIFGASFAVSIPQDILQIILICASILAITLVIVKPQPQLQANKKLLILGYISIALIGFWDGAIAMAGTTFFIIAAHYFFGMDYMKARVVNMFAAIPETIVSTAILTYHSTVTIMMGASLFTAATLGAFIGSKLAVKKGHEFIRTGMIYVSILMIVKLVVYDLVLKS